MQAGWRRQRAWSAASDVHPPPLGALVCGTAIESFPASSVRGADVAPCGGVADERHQQVDQYLAACTALGAAHRRPGHFTARLSARRSLAKPERKSSPSGLR